MAKKQAKKKDPEYKNLIKHREEIMKQYLQEKWYAMKVRQVKINNWIKNEEEYNGIPQKTLLTRSNFHTPIVFDAIHSMKGKFGGVPDLKYDPVPEGDENAPEIMAHVVKDDLIDCDFEDTFEDSKVECGMYGRTIYEVIPGNDKNEVELVDTMAYLISPIARNTKNALYQGRQFIYKTHHQIKEDAEKFEYDEQEVENLKIKEIPQYIQRDSSAEAALKNIRASIMGLANTSQYGSKVAELTKWWTYWKGKLVMLTVADDMYLLGMQSAKSLGLSRPPFISWGTYKRGITFWCPSLADLYRDTNMAVDVNMNQQIDNNTYRNFGMAFVSSRSGLKQSSISPRPLGLTPVEVGPNEKIQDHIYQPEVPQITDAVVTMQTIKGFADSASGMVPGVPAHKGKLTVTKQAQLQAEVEERIATMRANATRACRELFQLMADITKERLTVPRRVKIFGLKNLTVENVTKKNFKGVDLIAKATALEDSKQNKALKQKATVELYELFKDDPKVPGQIALRRIVAKRFELPADELNEIFTQEDQGQEKTNVTEETPGAGKEKAPTEATPVLSTGAKETAAQVPPKINPIPPIAVKA